jgi:hypothetical protein
MKIGITNRLWSQLSQTGNYSFDKLLIELVDNSLAARVNDKCTVRIEVSGDWNLNKNGSLDLNTASLSVLDNSAGLDESKLDKILAPFETIHNRKSLNEHGAGMKIALATLATTSDVDGISGFRITSKVAGKQPFSISTIDLTKDILPIYDGAYSSKFVDGHGTLIEITKLNKEVKTLPPQKQMYEKTVYNLGARYQKFIKSGQLVLTLILSDKQGKVLESADGKKYEWNVPVIEPVYSSTMHMHQLPLPSKADNQVEMIAGYAPTNEEFEEWGKSDDKYIQYDKKNYWHPYYHENNKVDIFMNGILVVQKDISWLIDNQDATVDRYFRNQKPRIQLHLRKHLNTEINKINFIDSPLLDQIKNLVKEKLISLKYIDKAAKYPQKEKTIKDSLEKQLVKQADLQTLKRESPIDGCGLIPDFEFIKGPDTILVEVKAGSIGSEDVSQLVGYMAAKGTNNNRTNIKGLIIGRDLLDSGKNYIQKLEKEQFSIRFEPLADYNL